MLTVPRFSGKFGGPAPPVSGLVLGVQSFLLRIGPVATDRNNLHALFGGGSSHGIKIICGRSGQLDPDHIH